MCVHFLIAILFQGFTNDPWVYSDCNVHFLSDVSLLVPGLFTDEERWNGVP